MPACLQGPYIEACKAKVQEIMRAAEEVHEQAITRMVGGCDCPAASSEPCCGCPSLVASARVFTFLLLPSGHDDGRVHTTKLDKHVY